MSIFRSNSIRAMRAALIAAALGVIPTTAVWASLDTQDPTPALTSKTQRVFPLPAGLEPAVDFWVKVFADWRRDQVALHDDTHLGVVYRVLDIPGTVAEGLTPGQRAWVRGQEERLATELSRLARKQAAGQALSKDEQKLAAAIKRGDGRIKGAADRVRSQRGTRERFLRGLEISGRYDQPFRAVFRAHGLPEDLAYLPHVESSFQIGARSSVGAAGMWQFMPSTARSYMTVSSVVDERLNPLAAAEGAARYFTGAYRTLGSWPLAVTSYNHGIGSMNRARQRYGHDFGRIVRDYDAPSFGFSSRNFYAEFLAVRRIAKSPHKYFPEGDKTSSFTVYGYTVAQTLVQVLKQCGDNLTRENVMKQAASLKGFTPTTVLPGIKVNTSATDFAPVEHLQMMKFKGERWELFGDVISGELGG